MNSDLAKPKVFLALLYCMTTIAGSAQAEQTTVSVALSAADASDQWHFSDDRATIAAGTLRLDGRSSPTYAFLKSPAWGDVSVSAKYRVETDAGVQAIGLIIGSTDSLRYHYVHYDKASAILCRSDVAEGWNELKRALAAHRPEQWHDVKLERKSDTISVYFNGKLLFETDDPNLNNGLVGFYASQTVGHIKDIVVTGSPVEAPKPWSFRQRPRDWIYVCTDAGAGAYEAFPDVCRTDDGRLICVFYAGYGHVAMPNEKLPKGGRISYCVSDDDGRTWSPAKTLFDGPDDDRDPSIVQLDDGRLVCNFFTLKPNPDRKPAWDGLGSWMVTSRDGGTTWDTEPQQIADNYYCSAPIRKLPDGRLILGLYKELPNGATGAVTISTDGGRSWNEPIDIPNGGMRLDAETDTIVLKNGDIFAALRGRQISAWSVSKDGGATWSVAEQFGFPGHCHYLHRAPGDIILMAHRLPATSLHFSLDEAQSWSENVIVDDVGGAYPSMVTLKDDSVLIVYYEEGNRSSIRAKRFRATPEGIEWLPFDTESQR